MLLRLAPLRASGGAHNTGLKEVEAGATVRAHTQQNPPGCHEGVWSNGPTGLFMDWLFDCSAPASSAPWRALLLEDRTGGATTPDACKRMQSVESVEGWRPCAHAGATSQ